MASGRCPRSPFFSSFSLVTRFFLLHVTPYQSHTLLSLSQPELSFQPL